MLLSSKRIALKALGRDEEGRGGEESWMGFQNTPSSKLPVHLWLNISTPASELIFNDFVWVVTLRKLCFWKVSGRIAHLRWYFQIWHFTLSVCEGITNHTHQQKLRAKLPRAVCIRNIFTYIPSSLKLPTQEAVVGPFPTKVPGKEHTRQWLFQSTCSSTAMLN